MVKGIARKHGYAATFMSKPFAEDTGTGLHVHFSVTDESGQNIFDNGTEEGSETLLHAVAGCLAAMRDQTLIFAPHGPSYDRLTPGNHAPTGVAWAYENRTAAIRIPGGPPAARRIEHRVAGGDTNPYLILAAILGAAMNGIEDGKAPPAPLTGNAYDQDLENIPADWSTAIDLFETSPAIARIFHSDLIRNLVLTKGQELAGYGALKEEERIALYLETV